MHLVDCFVDVFAYVQKLVNKEIDAGEAQEIRQKLDELFAAKAHLALDGGYQPTHYEKAKFAVVAWLDEKILGSNLDIRETWRSELAQRHYFNTTKGGQLFFEKLAGLDQFDAFDMDVREVFFYCLAFGFHGKYYSESGMQELALIKKANHQLLTQKKLSSSNTDKWFNTEPIAGQGAFQTTKPSGWAVLFGIPLVAVVMLAAWMRLDLYHMVEGLIKAL